jgi:holo-[acyl-carrier protein] synthase
MAILGLGVDLIEVKRFEREEARQGGDFARAFLLPAEIDRASRDPHPDAARAAHFAAKEAFLKALGTGLRGRLKWHDLEVVPRAGRGVALVIHGEAARLLAERGIDQVELSLTHTHGHAAALVVIAGGGRTAAGGRRSSHD